MSSLSGRRTFGIVTGVTASFLCLVAGVWLLAAVGFQTDDDALYTAIGIYFVGKAFFVGPSLFLMSSSSDSS